MYKKAEEKQIQEEENLKSVQQSKSTQTQNKKKLTYNEKREFENLEKEIAQLEKEKTEIVQKMSNPEINFDEIEDAPDEELEEIAEMPEDMDPEELDKL